MPRADTCERIDISVPVVVTVVMPWPTPPAALSMGIGPLGLSPPLCSPTHLCVWEVVPAWADAHIDLAWQVCKLLIAAAAVEQHTIHLIQHGPEWR